MSQEPHSYSKPAGPRVPQPLDYVGLGAALVPFVVSLRKSQENSVTVTTTDANGNTQTNTTGEASFTDPVAIVGGVVALLVGVVLLTQTTKVDKAKRGLRVGLAVAMVALGAYHLALRSGLLS